MRRLGCGVVAQLVDELFLFGLQLLEGVVLRDIPVGEEGHSTGE